VILTRVIKDIITQRRAGVAAAERIDMSAPSVLNVGGGSKAIPIPAHYKGFRHVLLDIDARGHPDLVADARKLTELPAAQFDAVYCSHNLEHYHKHEAAKVLGGFLHVLKPDGFVEIRVPDLKSVMKRAVAEDMSLEDTLYESKLGPITVRDVIYGYGKEIESSGSDFYSHKTGYVAASLESLLNSTGFARVYVTERADMYELHALAFKAEPAPQRRALLGL